MKYTESNQRITIGLPTNEGALPTQWVTSIAISGGVMMELTVAQWWASFGETEVIASDCDSGLPFSVLSGGALG